MKGRKKERDQERIERRGEGRVRARLTSVIFPQSDGAPKIDDLPLRSNDLETKNRSVQGSVSKKSKSSSVGRDVTSDVTPSRVKPKAKSAARFLDRCWEDGRSYSRSLSSQIKRHHVPILADLVVQDLENTSSVGGEDSCFRGDPRRSQLSL